MKICYNRQARRIAPEKMSLQLADTLYKVFFMERNMKLLVDYNSAWPVLSFPAYVIPEILYIWQLSVKIGITSPVPKLPLVYPGPGYENQHFGWSGSTAFSAAASLSKKLSSKGPSSITESAVEQVLFEIEESMSLSTTFDRGISEIEMCATSSSSVGITNSDKSTSSSSNDLTSPMPPRKNLSKCRKKDHSNKGGVGSHKINHQKLQLSIKVTKSISH